MLILRTKAETCSLYTHTKLRWGAPLHKVWKPLP